nr:YuiA family protein [Caldalkalibacillus salinus]
MKSKEQNVKCPYCYDHGYVQLLLGGTESCKHCTRHVEWNTNTKNHFSQPRIELVHLNLL